MRYLIELPEGMSTRGFRRIPYDEAFGYQYRNAYVMTVRGCRDCPLLSRAGLPMSGVRGWRRWFARWRLHVHYFVRDGSFFMWGVRHPLDSPPPPGAP